MKDIINGAQLSEMLLCAYEALEVNQQLINELNVFPVPDGDTGTNMTLTVSAAATELRHFSSESISEVADKAASAMLRGARGNSGVILSLLFRGIAKNLKGSKSATAVQFSAAMREGVDAAYKAVMKPAEGTILTVSRAVTDAAVDYANSKHTILQTLEYALSAGLDALEKTTQQNPVLARAGVVDAGGKGYVVILEAFLSSLQGKVHSGTVALGEEMDTHADFNLFSSEEITFAYDTVFIVRKTGEKSLDLLRAYLDSIGDSLVISEDDDVFKVHVHTNTPGDALNESQKYGVLETAKIENMRTQHEELIESKKETPQEELSIAPAEKEIGIVSVCAGDGISQVFLDLGCDRIVTGGQTMNPSTEDILREINLTPAETVFVFPNNKNIIMAAQQCIPLTDKNVVVVSTSTIPQGIAALLNFDPSSSSDELLATFNDVISGVHTALVTYAARDSEYDGHKIKAGEYLGLMDGALLGSWSSTKVLTRQLSKAIKKLKPEFVNVYYGSEVSEADAEVFQNALTSAFPDLEINLINGGQPVYYYMISIE